MSIKNILKRIIVQLPFSLTKNIYYDRLTQRVIRKVCAEESNCIDVGCHKGEVLDLMLRQAPKGLHFGFEPIPHLFQALRQKYADTNCQILDLACSNTSGSSTFNYVVSNPSYSGILKRQYDRAHEQDEQITVRLARLDEVIPPDVKIDFIKVDVEGAELQVLQGAQALLQRHKPIVVFECGLGASEVYGSTPEQIFELLDALGMRVSLLDRFLNNQPAFSQQAFCAEYYSRRNYYFIAY